MKFNCIARLDELSNKLAMKIENALQAQGYLKDEKAPELVVVVGGDGTFLLAAHEYMDQLDDICFIGIHTGTLGFFTDYTDDEVDQLLDDLINKQPKEISYQLLKVTYQDRCVYALNEMRVENVSRTQCIDVFVNDEEFETFSGTGLCICTQLGSTAFNRSLHGAVIQEGLPLLEMSEISGIHNRCYRSLGSSIIMKDDAKIKFIAESFDKALLCIDYMTFPLDGVKEINIELSKKHVRMLRYREVGYFNRLKSLF
ncbi:MAG: NAD kinase [Erysipelotrichaceae bacterium]|nr:NAD kinase [Erysipelotrichaceae bacterium]MDY5252974.1 NAD kinase [Erysipelotrichaceae bacterium]